MKWGVILALWGAQASATAPIKDTAPPPAAPSKISEIRVLARVADVVVTDRHVLIEAFLEKPELYVPGERRRKVSNELFDQSYQRLLAQIMVSQENKIVGLATVKDSEVDEALELLRKNLGPQAKRFQTEFELSDADLRRLLADKILLRKSLAARVRAATAKIPDPVGGKNVSREELAQASIDEWLKQLRARYRVQSFRE